MNKYLNGDVKNIICSLLRIVAFIKQCRLKNKTTKDIPQIGEFGFVTCDFLSAIYESTWDKLIANQDKKSFRQCISA